MATSEDHPWPPARTSRWPLTAEMGQFGQSATGEPRGRLTEWIFWASPPFNGTPMRRVGWGVRSNGIVPGRW